MVRFREVSVDDSDARALLTAYFADRAATFPGGPAAYVTRFPVASSFEGDEGTFLVAELDEFDSPIGCGGIRRLDAAGGASTRFEVKHLWVEPRARGLHAGRAILAELERRSLLAGATHLVLDTNASQREASGLYRSSGFVEVAPYNDNGNATMWFSKAL